MRVKSKTAKTRPGRHPSPRRILFSFFLLFLYLTNGRLQGVNSRAPNPPDPAKIGVLEGDFSVEDESGGEWTPLRLREKPTLLHFWTTSCAPCRREIRELRKIHRDPRFRDWQILGINLDGKDRPALRRFMAMQQIDWPQILEGGGFHGRLARIFHVSYVPGLFFIEADGTARRLSMDDLHRMGAAIRDQTQP